MNGAHEAWLVDLDGTLYKSLPIKIVMGTSLLLSGRKVMPAISAFRKAHESIREEGGVDETEDGMGDGTGDSDSPYERQLIRAAKDCQWPLEDLRKAVKLWMIEKPGPWLLRFRRQALISEIEAFKQQGGKTAVVSDYPASSKLRSMGLMDLFETVVCNGEPGGPKQLKPDPEGYLLAAKHLGVEPAKCLVIGDREDADGEAARRAGMGFRRV